MSNKKQEVKTQNRSGKGKYIISCIAISLGLIFVIPFVVNWLFSLSAPCELFEAKWLEADALSYGGAVLSFIGTVVLGAITVYQTREAHKQTEKANNQTEKANQLAQDALIQTEKANVLAAQMQKLEQARFVSMVSINDVSYGKASLGVVKNISAGHRTEIVEVPPFIYKNEDSAKCYIFYLDIVNESEYPIVQIVISTILGEDEDASALGTKLYANKAIYIAAHKKAELQLLFLSEELEKQEITDMTLEIDFVNVFDYETPAMLHLRNIGCGASFNYVYRLAKFVGVRPKRNDEVLNSCIDI